MYIYIFIYVCVYTCVTIHAHVHVCTCLCKTTETTANLSVSVHKVLQTPGQQPRLSLRAAILALTLVQWKRFTNQGRACHIKGPEP